MKKALFLIAVITFSFPSFAQNSPASDTTCPPVPWVNAEVQDNGNAVYVSWDVPCDTCEVNQYRLVWIDQFDPCNGEGPEDGNWHQRMFTTELSFLDNTWGPQAPGYYAYAVTAIYDTCESVFTYSNAFYLSSYDEFTVFVSLNDGANPSGAGVLAEGIISCNFDTTSYTEQANNSGKASFGEIENGIYKLTVSNPGYDTAIIKDIAFWNDTIISVELSKTPEPPPGDTCPEVAWVFSEVLDDGYVVVNWDLPCDTCQVIKYEVARIIDFNPCAGETPDSGTLEHRGYTNSLTYSAIYGMPRFTAYAIRAFYDSCYSKWVYSNVLYPEFETYTITTEVSLQGGGNPGGANVLVYGADFCNETISINTETDTDGKVYFEDLIKGNYGLMISKAGYLTDSIKDFELLKDSTISVELQLKQYAPPIDFTVDASTGIASWSMPSAKHNSISLEGFKLSLSNTIVAEPDAGERSYQFVSLIHNTEYTATISAIYDLGESDAVSFTFVTDFVGINENMGIAKVDFFPNPATDFLTIQSNQEIQKIEVFNYLGQIMLEKSVSGKQLKLNTSTLEAGIYIVKLKTATASVNRNLIIKR